MSKTQRSAVREKVPKFQQSVVTKNVKNSKVDKCEKFKGPWSPINAQNSKVHSRRKILKALKYAVTEKCQKLNQSQKCQNSKVEKCQKFKGPLSPINARNSKVRINWKMPKTKRSAVTEKCQKFKGLRSPKMPKTQSMMSWKNDRNS